MSEQPRLKIPVRAVVIDIIGAIVCAYGVLSLLSDGTSAIPLIRDRAAAGLLVVAGIVLMVYAVALIFRKMRASARPPPDRP